MPTNRHGKVKHLLKSSKAKVVKRCPFTIQLTYDTPNYRQEVICGVDTGSKYIGIACAGNRRVLYQSQIELRDDIKSKMNDRRGHRKFRRTKLRYRKSRFLNRKNSIKKDKYPPTLRSKFDSHIREIEFCKKILPISKIILETSKFDTQLIVKPWLQQYKWGYQKGVNYGYANARAHALDRDNYTCQYCKGKHKDSNLEVHHIIFRNQGGSDELDNLITLCHTCHTDLHSGKISPNFSGKKKSTLKYAVQMSILRSMLLKRYSEAIETFGYVTKANREALKLEKDHYIDAVVIASGGKPIELNTEIFYKKCINHQSRSMRKGIRGEKNIPLCKIHGFKKFDKVKYLGQECFVKGRRTNGNFVLMNIFNNTLDFRATGGKANPSYKEIQRIGARKSTLIERKDAIPVLS